MFFSFTLVTTFTSNPFAFDKFKDIGVALTVHLQEDGVILEPGSVGILPYDHPTILHLLNSINKGQLTAELFVSLFEQQLAANSSIFYDGCVVVGVVDWRPEMVLTLGNVGSTGRLNATTSHLSHQWTRRINHGPIGISNNNGNNSSNNNNNFVPETHKILLKPTPDCWRYALEILANSPETCPNYSEILQDEAKLLEFERQLILVNEPVVCLDPSPLVMFAMNALHYDAGKRNVFKPLKANPSSSSSSSCVLDDLDQTLLNLASLKPSQQSQLNRSTSPTATTTKESGNVHYRRIGAIESFREREKRRILEPIYGIDHRRQFVKNRTSLPASSFVPSNWRPFKTIRYEREILNSPALTTTTNPNPSTPPNPSTSLAKLYYCVNVFYAPPPTSPPIQLFLQVGTAPDTSTSGFLHRLQFSNLVETENYLQNLRNLLLIENGNCNLKVITDISTASTATPNPNNKNNSNNPNNPNPNNNSIPIRKPLPPQQQQQQQSQPPQMQPQFQLTPHQILQLNQQQQQNRSNESLNSNTRTTTNANTSTNTNINNNR